MNDDRVLHDDDIEELDLSKEKDGFERQDIFDFSLIKQYNQYNFLRGGKVL